MPSAMQHQLSGARAHFVLPVRVYYEDTDAAGIVYYATYLRYLERARTEWLRELGFNQSRLAERHGIAFAVRSLGVDYLRPARLDDLLDVVSEIESLGRAQMAFAQTVRRGDETLLRSSVRVVCVDLARMKPAEIPEDIRSRLEDLT
ncbi:MAG: tol-pal system-associated acyl-CoA thioesterase [Betaproteobacteria bacterium]|nr:tol-pal system-associated acyl-CoA thioesterase [Betaproteobacteria bacterium]